MGVALLYANNLQRKWTAKVTGEKKEKKTCRQSEGGLEALTEKKNEIAFYGMGMKN